jgi:hypothetical protein
MKCLSPSSPSSFLSYLFLFHIDKSAESIIKRVPTTPTLEERLSELYPQPKIGRKSVSELYHQPKIGRKFIRIVPST